jgi:hypothetical protein
LCTPVWLVCRRAELTCCVVFWSAARESSRQCKPCFVRTKRRSCIAT